jgi:alcohol dehydrogenase class IV
VGTGHGLLQRGSIVETILAEAGYSACVAPEKYAQLARILGLGGTTGRDRRERLFPRVDELLAEVDEPRT